MNNFLSKIVYNLIPGIITLIYASYLMFGWEGVRITLILILALSGLINVTIGLLALADKVHNEEKTNDKTK